MLGRESIAPLLADVSFVAFMPLARLRSNAKRRVETTKAGLQHATHLHAKEVPRRASGGAPRIIAPC